MKRAFHHLENRFTLSVPAIDLYSAQTAVFQGASGCGKSTLFDILGLIARADSADELVIRNPEATLDISTARDSCLTRLRSRMIGYVLQHGGLIPSLSVYDNIVIPCLLSGERPDKNRFESLVERLGIADQISKRPSRLSGGQQQRVSIARALINRPSIVLADEPTGQLDEFTAADVRDLLVNCVRDEGATLLVVTHDPQLFNDTANRKFGFEMRRTPGNIHSTLIEHPPK